MYCENCGKVNDNNNDFCVHCGKDIGEKHEIVVEKQDRLNKKKVIIKKIKKIFVGSVLIFILILFVNYYIKSSQPGDKSLEQSTIFGSDNTKAIVNIICDTEYGGSGTLLTNDGLILTNNHVISGAKICFVTIPDPITGKPMEMYTAIPIPVEKISEEYDIAVLMINDVYTDEEGYTWGKYPNTFFAFKEPDICKDVQWALGEQIKIYGYPSTSYNYNLTITDGIISNFDDDGYILTSAKIDTGNSGGLAVNNNGCIVGIPSAVLKGDYQNLGVIISSDIIDNFFEKAIAQLEKSETNYKN